MIGQRLKQQIEFIVEIDKLKTIIRQTLLMADPNRRENDAEHSWHLAMMITLLAEYVPAETDLLKAMKMVLIHDLVEIDAGDTFAYDEQGLEGKHQREKLAAERIFGLLPVDQSKELLALWHQFEIGKSLEAKFAVAVDRMHPFIHNVFTKGGTWAKFDVSADKVLTRMEPIKEASKELWAYIIDRVDEAVDKGYIKRAA